ncbi:MAG: lactonase family protein [Oscillospiraceae bacterium]|nr:lactonase family protein [Oscillospiraceae bacterium]
MYVASFDKSGGIYHYEINDNKVTEKQFVPLDRPTYLIIENNKLYAILRENQNSESEIVSFDLDESGNLTNMSAPVSTKGSVGCHLAVDGERVLVAHYGSGSLFASPNTSLKLSEKSKMHFVGLTPDKKYFCVCDLGLDKIFLFDKELNLKSEVKLKEGSGPRHICFDESGKYAYCALELSSEVVSLEYTDGKLKVLHYAPTTDFEGENYPAAIRICGDRVYLSNRGADDVALFAVKDGELSRIKNISVRGRWPRDIFVSQNLLISANQESDNLCFFEIKDNDLIEFLTEVNVKAPLCALVRG